MHPPLNSSVNQFEFSHTPRQESCRSQQNYSKCNCWEVKGTILYAHLTSLSNIGLRENFIQEICQNSQVKQLSEGINLLHDTALFPPEENHIISVYGRCLLLQNLRTCTFLSVQRSNYFNYCAQHENVWGKMPLLIIFWHLYLK